MELEYRKEYVDLISREVYSHTITTGIIVSIILGITSAIVLVVVFRLSSLEMIMLFTLVFAVLPINAIAYFVARRLMKTVLKEADRFVEAMIKIAEKLGTDRVELLEIPPPPYTSILKYDKYYIGINYYGDRGVYVSILDPIRVKSMEGYISIYLKKSREQITCREIDSKRICIYKLIAVLPEPLEDKTLEGDFYTYEFFHAKLEPDKISDILLKVFKEIEDLRSLFKTGGKE